MYTYYVMFFFLYVTELACRHKLHLISLVFGFLEKLLKLFNILMLHFKDFSWQITVSVILVYSWCLSSFFYDTIKTHTTEHMNKIKKKKNIIKDTIKNVCLFSDPNCHYHLFF